MARKEYLQALQDRFLDLPAPRRKQLAMCTLLEPRFRNFAFMDDAEKRQAMQDLRTEWANNWRGPVAAKPAAKPAANNVSLEELLAESDDDEPTLALANAEGDDLENYLLAPQVDMQTDVLAWWRGRRHVYPTVARMARQFLATSAGWNGFSVQPV